MTVIWEMKRFFKMCFLMSAKQYIDTVFAYLQWAFEGIFWKMCILTQEQMVFICSICENEWEASLNV